MNPYLGCGKEHINTEKIEYCIDCEKLKDLTFEELNFLVSKDLQLIHNINDYEIKNKKTICSKCQKQEEILYTGFCRKCSYKQCSQCNEFKVLEETGICFSCTIKNHMDSLPKNANSGCCEYRFVRGKYMGQFCNKPITIAGEKYCITCLKKRQS